MIEILRTGVGPGRHHPDERVAGLVVSRSSLVGRRKCELARRAELAVLAGSRRKSTISVSSPFASSIPATSASVTLSVVGSYCFAFALPNENMPPVVCFLIAQ
jgi:hypothetical protein